MKNGFGVRMERAEDHYVQVESAMLGSPCYTRGLVITLELASGSVADAR